MIARAENPPAPPADDKVDDLFEECRTWTEVSQCLYFECETLCAQVRDLKQRLEAETQALASERKQVEILRRNLGYVLGSGRFLVKHLLKLALAGLKVRPAPDPAPFLTYNCVPGQAQPSA